MAKAKYYTHVQPKLIEIEGWARDGLTDEQIAHNLGIAYSTFKVYKNEHEAFSAALKRGKEVVDREVENALLKRALGYKYDEVTHEQVAVKDAKGETIGYELQPTKVVTKEIAPDTTAQIFWLKNRKPIEWRDKKDIQHSGSISNPYENLTEEQLLKLAKLEEKQQ